jgi:HK97 family phage portal protein
MKRSGRRRKQQSYYGQTSLSVRAPTDMIVKDATVLNGVPDRGWMTIFDWKPGAWQANEPYVDEQAVLAHWIVFACMTLIAGDIGKLEFRLMQEDENGIEVEADSPAFSPVLRKPNDYQTAQKFFESWMFSKLAHGNTYVLLERDNRNVVVKMHVLDPSRVRPMVSDSGQVFYQLNDDALAGLDGDVPAAPASEIIHDRMWCLHHPLVGLSPIYASGLAAMQGLKIQGNSRKFFENMSRPSGVLTAPTHIKDETAKRIKDHWEAEFSGDKIGRVAVLGDGLKYEAMSVNPVEAQMVEQLKITAEMVCSTFHVPPFKVGLGQIPTYQNAEVLNQIYYSDCLQALIEAVENSLDDGLGAKAAGYCIEADLDDLLRMDSRTLIETLKEGVSSGIVAPNEARKKLNYAPTTGGDSPYLQQQNFNLEALAKRDAQEDPFSSNGTSQSAAQPESQPAMPPDEAQKQALVEMLDSILEARESEHQEALARATAETAKAIEQAMSHRQQMLDSFSRMLQQ